MKTTVLEKKGRRVSIYAGVNKARGGTPYYQVSWTPPGRERVQRSTSNAFKAQEIAEHALASMTAGRADLSALDPSVLSLIETVSQYASFAQIADKLMELVREKKERTAPRMEELVGLFERSREEKSKRHVETLHYHLSAFLEAFRTRDIGQITAIDIDAYLLAIPNPRTRLNHRISVVALFRFAQRKGWLPADKKTAAEQSERPEQEYADPEIFSPEETAALLAQVREDLVPYVVVAAFTGARSAEILRLRWKAWNSAERTLTFPREVTKTGRRRVVDVEPNAAAWLDREMEGKDPEALIAPLATVHRPLSAAATNCGIKWKQNGFRHSYASYHLQLHKNAPLTSKNCGHSVSVLENIYTKLTSKKLADGYFSIYPPKP